VKAGETILHQDDLWTDDRGLFAVAQVLYRMGMPTPACTRVRGIDNGSYYLVISSHLPPAQWFSHVDVTLTALSSL